MNERTAAKPRHWKRILLSIASGSFLSAFYACTYLHPGLDARSPESGRVDSLIVLKETIASGNFLRAVNMLSPSDRSPLLTPDGDVREEFKLRLRAVRLRTLTEDPEVRLRRGKLEGIANVLPSAGPGGALAADYDFETSSNDLSAEQNDSLRDLVYAAAKLLFSDIRSGVWQYPLNDMHPATRSLFLGRNGKIAEAAKARLSGIDTNRWEGLSLREGKLVGVMPLLPAPSPELRKGFLAFLKAIRGGEWAAAMDMVVERERRYLTGTMGRVNPAYAEKLVLLKRRDWDAFSLQSGKLSGLVAWLDEDQDPTGS